MIAPNKISDGLCETVPANIIKGVRNLMFLHFHHLPIIIEYNRPNLISCIDKMEDGKFQKFIGEKKRLLNKKGCWKIPTLKNCRIRRISNK